MNKQENENQKQVQETKPEEEIKQPSEPIKPEETEPIPAPVKFRTKLLQFTGKIFGYIVTKIVGGTLILVLIAAAILDLDQVPHGFSIQTTAKKIDFEIVNTAQAKPFKITIHPYLKTLSMSADKLNISTSEFLIEETNKPELKGTITAQVLEAKSKNSTYYQIQNLETGKIPAEIQFQPNKKEYKIRLEFKAEEGGDEKILSLHLPSGKTMLKLKTKESILLIHESEITYGNIATNTDGRRIRIKGKPHKINTEMQSSEQASVTIYAWTGKTYELEPEPNPPAQITRTRFLEASCDTKIYRYPREPFSIKDRCPPNPNIDIEGKIQEISKLEITDTGIHTVMKGEYNTIRMAEIEDENTRLNEVIDWLKIVNPFIKTLKGSNE